MATCFTVDERMPRNLLSEALSLSLGYPISHKRLCTILVPQRLYSQAPVTQAVSSGKVCLTELPS